MAKIRTIEEARAWREARESERTNIEIRLADYTGRFAEIRAALKNLSGIPTLSKLMAFFNAIKSIVEDMI